MGNSPATPGKTKLAFSSRTELREASRALREYLYLARTTEVDEILALSTRSKGQEAARRDLVENVTIQDNLAKVVYEQDKVSEGEIRGTAQAVTDLDPASSEPTLIVIPNERFANLNSGASNVPSAQTSASGSVNIADASISVMSVLDSGKGLNFSGRFTEYVALFANLIPTVELSKCVPYFTIKFIQNVSNRSNVAMPFMTLDSFVGAARTNSTFGAYQGQNVVPNSPITNPVENPSGKLGGTVTGMEIFQAPQTLVRPYVDKIMSHITTRGVPVLDPMVPLISIESINFDVSALSQNFMTTQTKIDLSLVLHDRSRMIEISPLISPGVYPTIKAEVEWGWSHPDSSKFSTNPYAKFLNALRSKQIFGVVGSSFSNRDASSLSIKLQLMGLGEFTASSTSILTAAYVPYELLRARMNQLFNIIETDENGTRVQKFVGAYEQTVQLGTWETGDKWVAYEDYKSIVDIITNASGLTEAKIDQIIEKYKDIVTNKIIKTQTGKDVSVANVTSTLRNDLIYDLSSASPAVSPYISVLYKDKPGLIEHLKGIASQAARDLGISEGESPLFTVGDLIYRLYCVPLAVTGFFDEIRINIFDFNDHAGKMSGLNIGSFVLDRKTVLNEVIKPNMNAQGAIQRIIGLVNNPTAPAYGVKNALLEKRKLEKELQERDDPDLPPLLETKADAKKVQDLFTAELTKIYQANQALGIGGSYEPKFVSPRVKLHTEVSSVKDGDVYKQVLSVYVYDEANSGARSVNLLLSLLQTSSGRVNLIQPGSNTKLVQGELNITKNDDGSYTVLGERQTTKNAITAAIPTIRIGSEGSVVINASYSSSGGGDLTNINLLKGFQNSGGNTRADVTPGLGVDMFVIPSTVNITMIGMPLINRGQMYYIDFGTGTSLDNVYTVTTVKHSIKGGQFTTSLTLNPINSGSIKSVTTNLQNDLQAVKKYKKQLAPK